MVLSAPNLLLEPSHRVTDPWGLIFDVTSSALGVSNFTPFRMQNPSECRLVGAFRESQLDCCIYGQAHGPRGSVTRDAVEFLRGHRRWRRWEVARLQVLKGTLRTPGCMPPTPTLLSARPLSAVTPSGLTSRRGEGRPFTSHLTLPLLSNLQAWFHWGQPSALKKLLLCLFPVFPQERRRTANSSCPNPSRVTGKSHPHLNHPGKLLLVFNPRV